MSLHASIPGEDIKTFATILSTLGAIGDELHFEAQRGQLVLAMINSSITTLGKVYISYRFFETYKTQDARNRPIDTVLFCQVAIKGFAALFKKQTKVLNSIEIKLDGASSLVHSPDNEFRPCRISVKRNGPLGHSGFSRTKSMPFAQTHPPNIDYSKDTANRFLIQPRHLREYLNFFNSKVEEIVFVCSRFNMKLRNGASSSALGDSSVDARPFQIEVTLNMDQFDLYEVCSDTILTLSIKDFKTMVNYAELLGEPVSAFFNDAGSPIIFSVKHTENTIFDMVLLTRSVPELNAYDSTQDDLSITRSSVNISQLSGPSGIHPPTTTTQRQPAHPSPIRTPQQHQPSRQQEEPLFPSHVTERHRNNSASDLVMLPLQTWNSSNNSNNSNSSQPRNGGEQNLFVFGSPQEDDNGTVKRRRLARRRMVPDESQAGNASDTDDGSGM